MSYINATVLKRPCTDDQQDIEVVQILGWDLPVKLPEEDYRARAHALIDALWEKDDRLAEGHFFTITMQP